MEDSCVSVLDMAEYKITLWWYSNVNLHLRDKNIQKVYSTSVAFVTEAVPHGTKTIEPWEFALVGHFRRQYLNNYPELR